MNGERVSFNISAEDKVRLKSLVERLRISESETLKYLLNREYQSWEEDSITGQEESEEG